MQNIQAAENVDVCMSVPEFHVSRGHRGPSYTMQEFIAESCQAARSSGSGRMPHLLHVSLNFFISPPGLIFRIFWSPPHLSFNNVIIHLIFHLMDLY